MQKMTNQQTGLKQVYVAFNEFTPPVQGTVMVENEIEALVRCEYSYTDAWTGDHPDAYETWEVHLPLGTHWVKKEQIFETRQEASKKYAFLEAKQKFEKYQEDLKKQALEIEEKHKTIYQKKLNQIKMWEDLDNIMKQKYEYRSRLWKSLAELEAKKIKLESEVLTLENFKKLIK